MLGVAAAAEGGLEGRQVEAAAQGRGQGGAHDKRPSARDPRSGMKRDEAGEKKKGERRERGKEVRPQ